MDSRFQKPVRGSILYLFGPQALAFDEQSLKTIHGAIMARGEDGQWILDTLAQLPTLVDSVASAHPSLQAVAQKSSDQLKDLSNALETGMSSVDLSSMPNTLLSPLVVIAQLLDFLDYLDAIRCSDTDFERSRDHLYPWPEVPKETLGLCIGMLSAFAVASSHNREDLKRYGAVAIRLAMAVGMIISAEEANETRGEAKCFSAAWHSEEQKDELLEILGSHEEAYISVWYDRNRTTITAPTTMVAELQQKCNSVGIATTELSLRGRFHWKHHLERAAELIKLCNSNALFQFTEPLGAEVPVHSSAEGSSAHYGSLHSKAIISILTEPPLWHQTFGRAKDDVLRDHNDSQIVTFGPERCVPPSYIRTLRAESIVMSEVERDTSRPLAKNPYSEEAVAVIGMSVKVAGANDVNEFWDLLCKGQSQHQEVPPDRFTFETPHRDLDKDRKWFGNFVDDFDKFDHKFFKKSPREIASTDPQQRQILQIAYQAVEQSGYFRNSAIDKHVGCYIGVCAVDYENNIACHPANAFSATGNLKGFIAGKVSHYFGWTGPGLTIDTACSSSAVAVHQACRAILGGECSAALAGGTHIMTNPLWYQNLAGASFLSKTGSCKPFDADADGYCRGEGVAAVFLKKLSAAIADGDQIYGVIGATAVQQNENCTPIVVPNVRSLSGLFRRVITKANVASEDVGLVEAHGTGTAVGDPAEYDSVRQVFGGPQRRDDLMISSVKGLVGHCECTSGLVSLIKTLLIIQKGAVPPQASFKRINPAIHATPSDRMTIPTTLRAWDPPFRVALINNYGASGSNASMLVLQAPLSSRKASDMALRESKWPFWIAGIDDRSIKANAKAITRYLKQQVDVSLSDMSFNVFRQSNPSLEKSVRFVCNSLGALEQQLMHIESGYAGAYSLSGLAPKPVILCFGGQTSSFVGLDRHLYNKTPVLRHHLEQCDAASVALGAGSIFPFIFEKSPTEDPVKVQTCLFALQYACAKCWISSGVKPVAVVGHSFGELVSLAIAGVWSLSEAISAVIARSNAIKQQWGSDRGVMMAVEADLGTVQSLLCLVNADLPDNTKIVIACYNGPRQFTLAGSSTAMNNLSQLLTEGGSTIFTRWKRLAVTHAFHSPLVDNIQNEVADNTADLQYGNPTIPVEHASETGCTQLFSTYVFDHMRKPVYFSHAVQRLAKRFPSALWLEAGSSSGITNLVSRNLSGSGDHEFQSLNIVGENAFDNLAEATVQLWNAGLRVDFWPHNNVQNGDYKALTLPPYQFEKSRHWLEHKQVPRTGISAAAKEKELLPDVPKTLLTFIGYQDEKRATARFRVNTSTPKYQNLMAEHIIAETAPILPATVQMGLATEALQSLVPLVDHLSPQFSDCENHAPVCADPSKLLHLDIEQCHGKKNTWVYYLKSCDSQNLTNQTTHTSGRISFRPNKDREVLLDFSRYDRFIEHQRCTSLLECNDADDVIKGRSIYKAFSDVVSYGDGYRGLQHLVGRGRESAGRVKKSYTSETWFDAHLLDTFCQVAGIWVNCMTDRNSSSMFIARSIEQWSRSPNLKHSDKMPESYDVFAYHQGPVNKSYISDVFVFNPSTGALMEVVLGISYIEVSKSSLSKLLSRLTPNVERPPADRSMSAPNLSGEQVKMPQKQVTVLSNGAKSRVSEHKPKVRVQVRPSPVKKVKQIISELSGIDLGHISDDSQLADLGIDSLMGMELAAELEKAFNINFTAEKLGELLDIPSVVEGIESLTAADCASPSSESSESSSIVSSPPSTVSLDETDSAQTSLNSSPFESTDVTLYISQVLGISKDEISRDVPLRDVGVDSLLAMEIRTDLHKKFGLHIPEDEVIEDMSINSIDTKLRGSTKIPSEANIASPLGARSTVSVPLTASGEIPSPSKELTITAAAVHEAFLDTKALTDNFIKDGGCENYMRLVLPKQTELCVVLALEAFEKMGASLKHLGPGQNVPRIKHRPDHSQLVNFLYKMLAKDSGLIYESDNGMTRTDVVYPSRSSKQLLEDLLRESPAHRHAHNLTYYAGSHLYEVFSGMTDGVKLIFGSAQGRELVSGLYGDWPLNRLFYKQMEHFLGRLVSKLPAGSGPLKVLEMGAGTGGTTQWLVPLLANLEFPVEYTFTDLAPTFITAARKRFKDYPFMVFRQHDISKVPAEDLQGSQHVIIASNAVHATHSLTESARNIRQALQPNGALLMLEMTASFNWTDIVFGLFEGWWLFDDGRTHAAADVAFWKRELQSVGFGCVDWTDGSCPENEFEKLIIGVNTPPTEATDPPSKFSTVRGNEKRNVRQAAVDDWVHKKTFDFVGPIHGSSVFDPPYKTVLLTGASGSIGTHIVSRLAKESDVKTIICLNRRSNEQPSARQLTSMASKGLTLSSEDLAKLKVLETDTSKPLLGLSADEYEFMLRNVTHVVHNAWIMSAKRPLPGFESQFHTMRNLIDLAREISCRRPASTKVNFQFVSSIAVVGHYPFWRQEIVCPEERMPIDAVLTNGYGHAKYICELMLDKTLHQHPDRFRTHAVRIGQIAGSKAHGCWNPIEHLSFLWKSSQTINHIPALDGLLSWTHVDDVADALVDLVLLDSVQPYPIYNIDNPVRQQWKDMIPILAEELGIPSENTIPFPEWIEMVRNLPAAQDSNNPAVKLIEFLENNFTRMSCGGLLLDTSKSREHSATMRAVGPVEEAATRRFVKYWRDVKFLS